MNPLLTKNYDAAGAITKHRIVAFTANDGEVQQASSSTDALAGVATVVGADQAGDRIDVRQAGIADVELGGNVNPGDYVTADADGKAVAASPGAGTNAQVIGKVLVNGADGDIAPVLLEITQIQG